MVFAAVSNEPTSWDSAFPRASLELRVPILRLWNKQAMVLSPGTGASVRWRRDNTNPSLNEIPTPS